MTTFGGVELDSDTLGPGQLLLEVRYSLISQGTELANFTGLDPGTRRAGSWNCYPHRPGYASTGTVGAAASPADGGPAFAIPDLVVEATGTPAGLRLALELVRDGGEVVLPGTPRGRSTSDATELMSAIHYRGLRLVGALEWLLPVRNAPWSARWSLYDSRGRVRLGAVTACSS